MKTPQEVKNWLEARIPHGGHMNEDTFVCENCRRRFRRIGARDEALAELEANTAKGMRWSAEDPLIVVCDECYELAMVSLTLGLRSGGSNEKP